MEHSDFAPLEPIVDRRWEHLVLALTAWAGTVSQLAAHLTEYNDLGPGDGAQLYDDIADSLRRFLPEVLETTDQTLIDDTALGVNLIQSYFSREILFVPKGVSLSDLLEDHDQRPTNRAQRRRRPRRG